MFDKRLEPRHRYSQLSGGRDLPAGGGRGGGDAPAGRRRPHAAGGNPASGVAAAQVDLTIPDRFGHMVRPREWFLAPLPVIDEVIGRIRDGSIVGYEYDPAQAALRPVRFASAASG